MGGQKSFYFWTWESSQEQYLKLKELLMKIRFPNTRQGISLPLWFRDEKFIFSRNEKLQFVQSSLPESLTSFIGRLMLNERKTSQKVSNDENITETSNTKSSTMERKKLFNPNKKYPVLSDKVSVRWDLLKCLKKYLFTYNRFEECRGRYLVADEDIAANEIIARESPIAAFPVNKEWKVRCEKMW